MEKMKEIMNETYVGITRLDALDEILDKADEAYWQGNDPIIEDYEYDEILEERNNLAEELGEPLRITADSNIFSDNEAMKKVEHAVPNYSVDRIKFDNQSHEEMLSLSPVKRLLEDSKTMHICMQPKLDGLSMSIQMNEAGKIYFLTRGKDQLGEDATYHFKNDRRFSQLTTAMKPGDVIRGEVVVSLKYAMANKLSRLRQYTVGIIKRKEPQNLKAAGLRFVAYTYYPYDGKNLSVTQQLYDLRHKFGLQVVNNDVLCIFDETDLSWGISTAFETRLRSDYERMSDCQIDGLMFKSMEVEQIARKNKSMAGALAVKFKPELYLTKLKEVEYRVGKSGRVTPMAHFDEILIDGSSVTKASLGSINSMNKLAPQEKWVHGSFIRVGLANDIIPQVYEANIDFSQYNQDEAWLEWRKAHSPGLIALNDNGSLLILKKSNSLKNRVRDMLNKNCSFLNVDTRFVSVISFRNAHKYEYYANVNQYIVDTIEFVMNVDLKTARIGVPIAEQVRNNRRRLKSLTFKNIVKNGFDSVYKKMQEDHLVYTFENVKKVIEEDNQMNKTISYAIPIYETLYKYCRK